MKPEDMDARELAMWIVEDGRTVCELRQVFAARDEARDASMREACAKAVLVLDRTNCEGYRDKLVAAIRAARRTPRFVKGQLMRYKSDGKIHTCTSDEFACTERLCEPLLTDDGKRLIIDAEGRCIVDE